ncbi:uncharacterized protein L969DRAFT_93606 [Mixia osmundae IAM 14324]|uniref:Uncharacterized protein n=1 Tax=Mixia osmundae (strain CBS 9802 / IAM 14324 / JCM 22182 / KY 12970) TaxID=764103 RepID=G7DUG3_MIXOS|nr:uncharacterized protein L969DRAFT_93606 [Mixia osmundae IAM 14324]KEI41096.1 hypothetical protein L969DRAFT_93606 [Mixia osmundae IAM 14324]GAA94223.1 hypothetical protein E5Q_00872 [Mixia osmundae IAM 14324]
MPGFEALSLSRALRRKQKRDKEKTVQRSDRTASAHCNDDVSSSANSRSLASMRALAGSQNLAASRSSTSLPARSRADSLYASDTYSSAAGSAFSSEDDDSDADRHNGVSAPYIEAKINARVNGPTAHGRLRPAARTANIPRPRSMYELDAADRATRRRPAEKKHKDAKKAEDRQNRTSVTERDRGSHTRKSARQPESLDSARSGRTKAYSAIATREDTIQENSPSSNRSSLAGSTTSSVAAGLKRSISLSSLKSSKSARSYRSTRSKSSQSVKHEQAKQRLKSTISGPIEARFERTDDPLFEQKSLSDDISRDEPHNASVHAMATRGNLSSFDAGRSSPSPEHSSSIGQAASFDILGHELNHRLSTDVLVPRSVSSSKPSHGSEEDILDIRIKALGSMKHESVGEGCLSLAELHGETQERPYGAQEPRSGYTGSHAIIRPTSRISALGIDRSLSMEPSVSLPVTASPLISSASSLEYSAMTATEVPETNFAQLVQERNCYHPSSVDCAPPADHLRSSRSADPSVTSASRRVIRTPRTSAPDLVCSRTAHLDTTRDLHASAAVYRSTVGASPRSPSVSATQSRTASSHKPRLQSITVDNLASDIEAIVQHADDQVLVRSLLGDILNRVAQGQLDRSHALTHQDLASAEEDVELDTSLRLSGGWRERYCPSVPESVASSPRLHSTETQTYLDLDDAWLEPQGINACTRSRINTDGSAIPKNDYFEPRSAISTPSLTSSSDLSSDPGSPYQMARQSRTPASRARDAQVRTEAMRTALKGACRPFELTLGSKMCWDARDSLADGLGAAVAASNTRQALLGGRGVSVMNMDGAALYNAGFAPPLALSAALRDRRSSDDSDTLPSPNPRYSGFPGGQSTMRSPLENLALTLAGMQQPSGSTGLPSAIAAGPSSTSGSTTERSAGDSSTDQSVHSSMTGSASTTRTDTAIDIPRRGGSLDLSRSEPISTYPTKSIHEPVRESEEPEEEADHAGPVAHEEVEPAPRIYNERPTSMWSSGFGALKAIGSTAASVSTGWVWGAGDNGKSTDASELNDKDGSELRGWMKDSMREAARTETLRVPGGFSSGHSTPGAPSPAMTATELTDANDFDHDDDMLSRDSSRANAREVEDPDKHLVTETPWGTIHGMLPPGFHEEFAKAMEELSQQEHMPQAATAATETHTSAPPPQDSDRSSDSLATGRRDRESPVARQPIVSMTSSLSQSRLFGGQTEGGRATVEPDRLSVDTEPSRRDSLSSSSPSMTSNSVRSPVESVAGLPRPGDLRHSSSFASNLTASSSPSSTRSGSIKKLGSIFGRKERSPSIALPADVPEDDDDADYVDYSIGRAIGAGASRSPSSATGVLADAATLTASKGERRSSLRRTSRYAAATPRDKTSSISEEGESKKAYGVRFANATRGLGLRQVAESEADHAGGEDFALRWVGIGRGRYGNLVIEEQSEEAYAQQVTEIKSKWDPYNMLTLAVQAGARFASTECAHTSPPRCTHSRNACDIILLHSSLPAKL